MMDIVVSAHAGDGRLGQQYSDTLGLPRYEFAEARKRGIALGRKGGKAYDIMFSDPHGSVMGTPGADARRLAACFWMSVDQGDPEDKPARVAMLKEQMEDMENTSGYCPSGRCNRMLQCVYPFSPAALKEAKAASM